MADAAQEVLKAWVTKAAAGRVGALTLLDHGEPLAALRVGQHCRVARQQLREEAHVVRVVGDDQEVERPGQPGATGSAATPDALSMAPL